MRMAGHVFLFVAGLFLVSGCESYYKWQYETCITCDLPVDCHGNQRGSAKYDPDCK